MKSYTDLEQSKKLAEMLPIESADMCYQKVHAKQEYFDIAINVPPENQNDLPCWSLTALMNILERGAIFKAPQQIWACQTYTEHKAITSNYHSNPVDACYEMVIKLHELKML